jgi:hypothetical protein
MKLQKKIAKMARETADQILATVGLEVMKPHQGLVLPLALAFGSGVITSALITPISGRELRARIADFVGNISLKKVTALHEVSTAWLPMTTPFEEPRSQQDSHEASRSRKTARQMPVTETTAPPTPSATS